ncbi:roadblock/LC7 domain-containing protein [Actinocorallia aurea]
MSQTLEGALREAALGLPAVAQADTEAVLRELASLRADVPGVTAAAAASLDGMLIAAVPDEGRPDVTAALAATALGLGRTTGAEIALGRPGEVVIQCADGRLSVRPVGRRSLLVVLGDASLDLPRLTERSTAAVESLEPLLES